MSKIRASYHVVSQQSNKLELKFDGTNLSIGQSILPHYKYDDFDLHFKIICPNSYRVDCRSDILYGSDFGVFYLYSKFFNKKPILEYVLQISVIGYDKEEQTVLSPSHSWTEIYGSSNFENKFDLLVKVAWDQTSSSGVQTNNKCVQTEKETKKSIVINPVKTIYEDEDLPDFHIVGELNEGIKKSVGFHRTVLYAWSPAFKKMFTEAWKEKSEGKVELPWNVEVIEAFKKFLYLQELPSDRETLLSLIEMGSCYMIPKLESDAIQAVVNITNAENINESLEFSYIKKLKKLTTAMLLEIKSSDIDVTSI